MEGQYWSRKALPNPTSTKKVRSKLRNHPERRGRFVIRGSSAQQMKKIWKRVERQTIDGRLGYFTNFSDDDMTIIVYHSSWRNRSESQRIENRLEDICHGFDVNLTHRTNDPYAQVMNTSFEDIGPLSDWDDDEDEANSDSNAEDFIDDDYTETESESDEDSESDTEEESSESSSDEEVVIIIKKRKKSPKKRVTRSVTKRSGKRLRI